VEDMGVEEARSHLFTTEHRQFLQDRLEDVEEDWCAFAVCHELKESGFQDIHVIKIPYSMKEKTFKKFVEAFGELSKFKLMKGTIKGVKVQHAFFNYTHTEDLHCNRTVEEK
jgi:hypothetical protein